MSEANTRCVRAPSGRRAPSLRDPVFAIRLAGLLGEAAAPNLIVGCRLSNGEALFDRGDEVIGFDFRGLPSRLYVADHTGTFSDYQTTFGDWHTAGLQDALGQILVA